jgi:hypothetical protein
MYQGNGTVLFCNRTKLCQCDGVVASQYDGTCIFLQNVGNPFLNCLVGGMDITGSNICWG